MRYPFHALALAGAMLVPSTLYAEDKLDPRDLSKCELWAVPPGLGKHGTTVKLLGFLFLEEDEPTEDRLSLEPEFPGSERGLIFEHVRGSRYTHLGSDIAPIAIFQTIHPTEASRLYFSMPAAGRYAAYVVSESSNAHTTRGNELLKRPRHLHKASGDFNLTCQSNFGVRYLLPVLPSPGDPSEVSEPRDGMLAKLMEDEEGMASPSPNAGLEAKKIAPMAAALSKKGKVSTKDGDLANLGEDLAKSRRASDKAETAAGGDAREGDVPVDPTTVRADADTKSNRPEPGGAKAVCSLSLRRFSVDSADFTSEYGVAGLLREASDIPSYSDIEGVFFPEDEVFATKPGSHMIPLALPRGLAVSRDVNGRPFIAASITDKKLVTTGQQGVVPPGDGARLLVVGASGDVATSGLETLEQATIDLVGPNRWTVDWLEIGADGGVTEIPGFNSFSELVDEVSGSTEVASGADFGRLMSGIEAYMRMTERPVDLVIWIADFGSLPHTAPGELSAMISSVAKEGQIARLPRGEPRKWLQVLVGSGTVRYVREYLRGPVISLNAGYFHTGTSTAPRPAENRNAANDVAEVVRRVDRETGFEPVPSAPGIAASERIFDAGTLFSDVGLIVAREAFDRFNMSIVLTDRAIEGQEPTRDGSDDLTELLNTSTGELGLKSLEPGVLSIRPYSKLSDRRLNLLRGVPGGSKTLTNAFAPLAGAIEEVAILQTMRECDYAFLPLVQFDGASAASGRVEELVSEFEVTEDAAIRKETVSTEPTMKEKDRLLDWTQLTIEERRLVQDRLSKRGFYKLEIDGLYGPGTEAAIEAYRTTVGGSADGMLTRGEFKALTGREAEAFRE